MHHHHDAVGKEFFPSVEEISGVEGLMARNVEQHRAFTPGFEHFETYCLTCEPAEYDGENLQSLVEGFAGPLVQHLRDEIDTLRVLDKYDSDRIRQAYKRFEKSLMNTDNVRPLHSDRQDGADIVLVSHRSLGIRDSRPKFRGRHS